MVHIKYRSSLFQVTPQTTSIATTPSQHLPYPFFCGPAEVVASKTTPPHADAAAVASANTPSYTKMCRLPAAVLAAMLLPATTPIILGTTLSTTALLGSAGPSQAQTADNLLAQAKALLGKKDSEQEVIWLSNQVLFTIQSADAYLYRAYAKYGLGDKQGAIADFNQAIAINPQYAKAYYNRGVTKYGLGDKQGAIADYNEAIAINPQEANAYINRGSAKDDLGDKQGAIADYNQAIAIINPQYAISYNNRGNAKYDLGDKQGACSDYKKASSLGNKSSIKYLQGQNGAWCRNMR